MKDCTAPSDLERNRYYFGKELTARDFEAEQAYVNGRRHLINRSIFGWGVVCGLDVSLDPCGAVVVAPGLALDCRGREVLVPSEDREQNASTLVDKIKSGAAPADAVWWICLEHHECEVEPVTMPNLCTTADPCGPPMPEHVFNRVRDGYRITLRLDTVADCPPPQSYDELCVEGGGLEQRLCQHVSRPCPDPHKCCDCIPLGALSVCPETDQVILDPCGPRRLVYGNPLLKELATCHRADLPRITAISWADVHGVHDPVDFTVVEGHLRNGLKVEFDHPMDLETVHKHSFLVHVIAQDNAGRWVTYRVPAGEFGKCPDGHSVTFKPTEDWLEREVDNPCTSIFDCVTEIEVILRGSIIRDQNGHALDGEAIAFPTGNGRPGGEFISAFSVAKKNS